MILSLKKRDILFILGDFLFDSEHYEETVERLKQKKCRIKLIMGNHDSLKLYKEDWIEMQLPLFSYKNHWITHCPIHPDEIRNRAGCIHGHLHGGYIEKSIPQGYYVKKERDHRYFNVNLDNNDFKFVTMDQMMKYLKHSRLVFIKGNIVVKMLSTLMS
jgi:calcineurin-like phosphoesterase family protein